MNFWRLGNERRNKKQEEILKLFFYSLPPCQRLINSHTPTHTHTHTHTQVVGNDLGSSCSSSSRSQVDVTAYCITQVHNALCVLYPLYFHNQAPSRCNCIPTLLMFIMLYVYTTLSIVTATAPSNCDSKHCLCL